VSRRARELLRSLLLTIIIVFGMSTALAVVICPYCHSKNSDDAEHCAQCGKPLFNTVDVPSVVGMAADSASSRLDSAGFIVSVAKVQREGTPGRVLDQSPSAGRRRFRIGAARSVTIRVCAAPPEPAWLANIKVSSGGWPTLNRSAAKIAIGIPMDSVRKILGRPANDTGVIWDYPHGEDELRVVFALGLVDTMNVSMSESLRRSLTTPLDKYILPTLAAKEPEDSDSVRRTYPEDGITIFYRSGAVSGFSFYPPRAEAPWVAALRAKWRTLFSPSPASLALLTPNAIEQILGPPGREGNDSMVYEDRGSRLVFSLSGGETDTIVLTLAGALQRTFPGLRTREDAENMYGKTESLAVPDGGWKLVYADSGLRLVFDSQYLNSVRRYYPEYYNMVLVPAGRFCLGTSDLQRREMSGNPDWRKKDFGNEMPQKGVYLDSFYIDKYEVSNGQFLRFLRSGNKVQGDSNGVIHGLSNCPVAGVTWNDAAAYAKWAGKRLPTEMEWEKAARGTQGWSFPWGISYFDGDVSWRANYRRGDSLNGTLVPVDSLSGGKSVYGAYNMAGNVVEWCANPYVSRYYDNVDTLRPKGPQNFRGDSLASVRGGSFQTPLFELRSAYRHGLPKNATRSDVGFRCVKDVNVKKETK